MMKRLTFIALCLLALMPSVQAQQLTLEYNLGYGTFAMGDLKETLSQSDVSLNNLKVTDNFPGYIVNQAKIGLDFKQMHHTGILLDFMSTAGSKGVSDYSGSYHFTIRTKGTRLGAFYRFTPRGWQTHTIRPYLQLSGGVIFNNAELEEELVIAKKQEHLDRMSLGGLNSYVEPAVGCRIRLLAHLDLNVSAGYEFDLTKKFTDKSGQYTAIAISPDWSGIRLTGGLIYSIPLTR